jgi:ectoine hydroxylase-related dioxygenase (phytanoyl-CoA dioxygenase family)
MRSRLEELIAVTAQDHAGTLIVGGLLDEEVFDAAWQHPRVLAAVRHLLGDEYRLTGLASRGLRPGHGQQALHVDWGGQGVPGVWYACHAICAIVAFTHDNGATRVVPGSHRNPSMLRGLSDPRKPHPLQRQLIGGAGTVFILNIHCAHSAVHNASGEPRLAVFAHFSRRDSPLLMVNPPPEPSSETLARHGAEIRAILTG